MTTKEINGIRIEETVSNVSSRQSRRGKPGVNVSWKVVGTSRWIEIERDTYEEAVKRCEEKLTA